MTRVALLAAALVALAIPSSAQAIGLDNLAAEPDPVTGTTQAGENTDFSIHIEFTDSGDDVRNLVIGLPPGQIGDPTAAPLCSVTSFNADTCDTTAPGSAVGSVTTNVTAYPLGLPLGLPISAPGTLYNIPAQGGDPARFGIVLRPLGGIAGKIFLESGVELRQDDFGLNTVILEIPRVAPPLLQIIPIPIDVTSMDVDLLGQGANGGFIRNPTSCTQATTNFSATSYDGSTTVTPATGSASFTPTGCDTLPFSPSFSARMGAPGQNSPLGKPPVTTVIEQDADEAGLAQAAVTLPPDIAPDFPQLSDACQPAQFAAAACPPNTVVGQALATSPLLTQPLTGPVTVVKRPELPDIGLNLSGPLTLNLLGTLSFQNVVTFGGLPDIPISRFELTFIGGPEGLNIATRELCVPPPPLFHETFLGHNGAATALDTPATIEGGCGPAKCKKKATKKKKGKKSDASAAKKKKKKNPCKKKKKRKKKR